MQASGECSLAPTFPGPVHSVQQQLALVWVMSETAHACDLRACTCMHAVGRHHMLCWCLRYGASHTCGVLHHTSLSTGVYVDHWWPSVEVCEALRLRLCPVFGVCGHSRTADQAPLKQCCPRGHGFCVGCRCFVAPRVSECAESCLALAARRTSYLARKREQSSCQLASAVWSDCRGVCGP